jgi:uncharacterized GH25 family protein
MTLRTCFATAIATVAIVVLAHQTATPVYAQAAAKPKTAKPAALDIMLMQPKAVKAGENQFEVMVKGADGKPVTGADVSIQFVMPKTAKMAEMRNEVKLKPSGAGMYAGSGMVMMAGMWNTTVMVMKDGKNLGQKKIPLTAK